MSGYISVGDFVGYPLMFVCTILLIMGAIKLYQITYNFIFRRNIDIPCGYAYISSKIWGTYHNYDLLLVVVTFLVMVAHLFIGLCFDLLFGIWGEGHVVRYVPVWCIFYFVLFIIPFVLRSIADRFLGDEVERREREIRRGCGK